jgi:hypothetical protein
MNKLLTILGASLLAFAIGAGAVLIDAAINRGGDEPDTVVAVLLKCERPATSQTAGPIRRAGDPIVAVPAQALSGKDCVEKGVQNVRLELTVRTPGGATYTADVPPDTRVSTGDRWPQPR